MARRFYFSRVRDPVITKQHMDQRHRRWYRRIPARSLRGDREGRLRWLRQHHDCGRVQLWNEHLPRAHGAI